MPACRAAPPTAPRLSLLACPPAGARRCTCIYGTALPPAPEPPPEQQRHKELRCAAWHLLRSGASAAGEPVALMLPKLVRQGRTSPLGSTQLPATAVAAAAAARLEQAQAAATAAAMQAASLAAAAGLPYRLPAALGDVELPPVTVVSEAPGQRGAGWRSGPGQARQQGSAAAPACARPSSGLRLPSTLSPCSLNRPTCLSLSGRWRQ